MWTRAAPGLPPSSSPKYAENMPLRVETSAEAELDAILILEWLLAQSAGDTGLRWFMAMDEAIASPANLPEECAWRPRMLTPLMFASFSTGTSGRRIKLFDARPYRPTSRGWINLNWGDTEAMDRQRGHISKTHWAVDPMFRTRMAGNCNPFRIPDQAATRGACHIRSSLLFRF
jgi:hypothetical protein